MSAAAPSSGPTVGDALDALVSQFSSTLDCYRELVQNSIDAGSPRVDVWMEYHTPKSGSGGTIVVHVDDFGEGMDEAIIDNELTQLFASSKENDLTKIGKFGIGFVSIFALEPRAVLVHTGRGGEYWEVLFHEDRSFSKSAIDEPVEGTQISLFIAGDRHRYNELVDGTRLALKRWCSHSETEVTFEDRSDTAAPGPELINEPFEVSGELMTRVSHQGTEIVLAYNRAPSYSFHNKGLTLMRTADPEEALGDRAGRFRQVAFRIKSRYLEHTLSRETILKDQNYEKAVRLLLGAANDHLFAALVDEIERLASEPQLTVVNAERYMHLLSFLAAEPTELLRAVDDRPMLRTVSGEPASFAAAAAAHSRDGWLFIANERSKVTDMLTSQGTPVLLGRHPSRQALAREGEEWYVYQPTRSVVLEYLLALDARRWVSRLSERLGVNLRASITDFASFLTYDPRARINAQITDPHDVYLAVREVSDLPATERDLVINAEVLLDHVGAACRRLAVCKLEAGVADPPLFVVGREGGRLMARPPYALESGSRAVAAINREHPQFCSLVELFAERPELASYCLAKDLLLVEDRLLNLDMALITAARYKRPKRLRGSHRVRD